jgi:hypothetical protein
MAVYDEYLDVDGEGTPFPAIGVCELCIQGLTQGSVKVQYLIPQTEKMLSPEWVDFPGLAFSTNVYQKVYLSDPGVSFRVVGDGNNDGVYVRFRPLDTGVSVVYNVEQPQGVYLGRGWDDLVTSLIGLTLNSVIGTVQYNYTENTITMQPNGDVSDNNDVVNFNLAYPHSAEPEGELRLHVHWEQPNATNRTFTLQYRVQPNGQAKQTVWSTLTANSNIDSKFPYVSGTLNQVTTFPAISLTNAGLSPTIDFRLTRSDANADNIEVKFVDAHIFIVSAGSAQEFSYT